MFSSFLDILQPQLGKYGRDIIHDDNDFNAIMTTAVPAGAAVGAFTGGFLAAMGRRRAIFLVNAILCLGTGISMIFHFFSILAGRLIVGYSVGALTVLTPMFISETSPVKLLGPLGTLNQVMATIGIMVGYFLGFLAPLSLKSDDSENFAIYSTILTY